MTLTIGELKHQGAEARASGQTERALRILWRLMDAAPAEVDLRLQLADLLMDLGAAEAAVPVYKAAAIVATESGHPLVAVLAAKILEAGGGDVGPLYDRLAARYGAESDRISRYGERFAPLPEDTPVQPPDFEVSLSLEQLVTGASRAGADLERVGEYPRMLHRMPLMSDLSDSTFRRVLDAMQAHRLPDGALVVREGEMGAGFFFLAQGAVRAYRTNLQGQQTELARLHAGSLFGEMALIHASPRTASVQTVGPSSVLEVTREGLSPLAAERQAVAVALDRFCRDRLLHNLLATAPIFRAFSRRQRMDLLKRFTGHDVAPGTVVLREGDPGRGLYVVLSGEVDVTKRDAAGQDVLLASLKAGEVFGEIALVKGGPATASVVAARQSTILFLDQIYFQRLIQAIPEMKRYFDRLSDERLADTRAAMDEDLLVEDAAEDAWVLI